LVTWLQQLDPDIMTSYGFQVEPSSNLFRVNLPLEDPFRKQ